MQAPNAGDTADIVYAGFWRRCGALLIDALVLGMGFYAVVFAAALAAGLSGAWAGVAQGRMPAWFIPAYVGLLLAYYLAAALYYSLQESSAQQATLGKRALGIKVVDAQGRRLSRGHALGRWFAAALSYLTLYIGFLMAAFTGRKQALHDMVAGTLVVDRWAWTEHPERQQRHIGALPVVLGLLLLAVPMLGIIAAIAIPQYQDYVYRARVATAIAAARPLQTLVEAARRQDGDCPGNGEAGLRDPNDYATVELASIEAGPMQDSGACALQLTLRGAGNAALDGKRLWLELDPGTGRWTCSAEIEDRYLPRDCRG
jgi:uncharacterized RDD family membrane protein YckC/type II secretory pathway pseudopilin PulG